MPSISKSMNHKGHKEHEEAEVKAFVILGVLRG
jgi:hypothetical protein